jgi:hypothetical protein
VGRPTIDVSMTLVGVYKGTFVIQLTCMHDDDACVCVCVSVCVCVYVLTPFAHLVAR